MTIENFGDDVRIERRAAPVKMVQRLRSDGRPATTKAGYPLTSNVMNLDADGKPIYAWVLYRRQAVVDGIHPWIGVPTSMTHVWMPVGEFNEYEAAADAARQLAGQ